MKKRILGLALAATMLIGTSMTAFAQNDSVSSNKATMDTYNEVTATGTLASANISVTVTIYNGTINLNPYKLNSISYMKWDGTSVSSNAADTLTPQYIKFENNSDVPIGVGLKGKIEISGNNLTVATSKPTSSTTGKQVYVEAQFTNGKTYTSGTGASAVTKFRTPATAATLVYGTTEKSLTQSAVPVMCVAADDGKSDTGAAVSEVANGPLTTGARSKTLVLVISGGTSADATKPWESGDKITVTTSYNLQYMTGTMKESLFK